MQPGSNGIPISPALSRALWLSAIVAGVAWYGWFHLLEPLRHEPFRSAQLHGNDFRHIYLGSWMLARGQDPYDAEALLRLAHGRGLGSVNPYVYLPFTGLVLSPLTFLDPPDAFRAWFLLNHLFLAIAWALMFWSLRLRPDLPDLAFAVLTAALCYPLHRTLTAGQLNCALLLLFALVFGLERRGWFIAAGGAAAFAFLFKLTPGVLFLYFLWGAVLGRGEARAGRWRALAAMAFFSLLLMGVAVAWVGVDRHLAFRPVLAQMNYGRTTWAEYGQQYYRDAANQSLNSFFHHVVAAGGGTAPWIPLGVGWANGLTRLAFLICVGLVAWRLLSDRAIVQSPSTGADAQGDADSMPYALFILLSLLAPSIYWDHYAVIALWPLLACWSRLPREARPAALVLEAAVALLLGSFLEVDVWLAMLFLIAALFAVGHLCVRRRSWGWRPLFWALAAAMLLARFPFDFPAFRHGVGLLAMSLKLWGTLALFGLALAMAGERTRNSRPDATMPQES